MAKTVYMDLEFSDDLEKIRSQNSNCQNMLSALLHENECLLKKFSLDKKQKIDLQTNISSLYKTAIAEIARKDKEIARLKTEIDNIVFRRDNIINRSNNVNQTSRNSVNERGNRNITDKLSEVNRTAPSILKDANNSSENCPKSPNYRNEKTHIGGSNCSPKDVFKRSERPATMSVVDERKIKQTRSYSNDSIDDERFKRTASEFEKDYYEMEKSLHLGHSKKKRSNSPIMASRNIRDRQSQIQNPHAHKSSKWDLISERRHPHSRSRSREKYRRSQEGSKRYQRDKDDLRKDLRRNERESNFNLHNMKSSRRSNEHLKNVENDCSTRPGNKRDPTLNLTTKDVDKEYIKTDPNKNSELKGCHIDEPSKIIQKVLKNDSESFTLKLGNEDVHSENHNTLGDDLEEGEISVDEDSNVILKEISLNDKVTRNNSTKNYISLNLEIKDKKVSPSHFNCKTQVEGNDSNISKCNESIKKDKISNPIVEKFEKSYSATTESNLLFNKMNEDLHRQNDISSNSQSILEAKNNKVLIPNNNSIFDTTDNKNILKDNKNQDTKNSNHIETDLLKVRRKDIPLTALHKSESKKNLIHTLFDSETIDIGMQRDHETNTLFSNKLLNNVHTSLPYKTKEKDVNNVSNENCTLSQKTDRENRLKDNPEVDKNKLAKKSLGKDEYLHTEPPTKSDDNQLINNIPGGATSNSKCKQSKESHTGHTQISKAKHFRLKSLKFDFNNKRSEDMHKNEVSPPKKVNLSNDFVKQTTDCKEEINYSLFNTTAENTSEIKLNKDAMNPIETLKQKNIIGGKDSSSNLPITFEKSSENNQVKQTCSENKILGEVPDLVIHNDVSQCIETKNTLKKTSDVEEISNSSVCISIKENEDNLPVIDQSKNVTTTIVHPTTNNVNPTTIHFKVQRKRSTIVKKVK